MCIFLVLLCPLLSNAFVFSTMEFRGQGNFVTLAKGHLFVHCQDFQRTSPLKLLVHLCVDFKIILHFAQLLSSRRRSAAQNICSHRLKVKVTLEGHVKMVIN